MAGNKKEYDWIDDPFKEEPQQHKQGMSTGSKAFIGGGCLVVLIGLIVVSVMFFSGMYSALV